jgi:hypothetical protein
MWRTVIDCYVKHQNTEKRRNMNVANKLQIYPCARGEGMWGAVEV